jgi:hypothetical protein
LLYTADLPTSPTYTTATFADNTAVLAMDSDPATASQKLQANLTAIQNWFKKWRTEANGSMSVPVTFTMRNVQLTWYKHIFTKRKQLGITLTKMY